MSIGIEDYLKFIYKRQQRNDGPVKTADIVQELNLTMPSVNEMVRRLDDKELLTYAPYKGVTLTKKGFELGEKMVRRHRLIEVYLQQFLGYTKYDVHDEAERLEHAVSDTLIDRMDKALGYPVVDPHGSPIPQKKED